MYVIYRAVICVVFVQISGCQLHIRIQPNKTDVEKFEDVTIRCSLNLHQTKTDRVYSIMLKRRGITVAVLLTGGVELPDRQYIVDGTLNANHSGSAYLQLTLYNVTCSDRGDYSCRMAVRRSYRNLQLGPVSSPFTVIGKPSAITSMIAPSKNIYPLGDMVTFTCSTLTKSTHIDWLWNLTSPPTKISESCSYIKSQCLYRCTSKVLHSVTQDDTKVQNRCGYDGNFKNINLNTASFNSVLSEGTPFITETQKPLAESSKPTRLDIWTPAAEVSGTSVFHLSDQTTGGERLGRKTILIYSFVSVFCFIFLCILFYIFASDRCECHIMYSNKRHRYNHNRQMQEQRSERHGAEFFLDSQSHRSIRHCESQYLIPLHKHYTDTRLTTHEPAISDHIYEEVGQSADVCRFESETSGENTVQCHKNSTNVAGETL